MKQFDTLQNSKITVSKHYHLQSSTISRWNVKGSDVIIYRFVEATGTDLVWGFDSINNHKGRKTKGTKALLGSEPDVYNNRL